MDCEMCAGIAGMESGGDANAVARLQTGYVTICATQYFRGYTFFEAKSCVREIYDLPRAERDLHLHEMTEVARAIASAFAPAKMNYEALGNGVPHLHWHLIPRYDTDPHPRGPVWEDLAFLRQFWARGVETEQAKRDDVRRLLLAALRRVDVEIERVLVDG
jgi:diadenosine tetraphosphate (Ap4A) HIT family hydrolase